MDRTFLGVGIYSVPEAAQLVDVPARRIIRWLAGYTYKRRGLDHTIGPVWPAQLPRIEGRRALGFLDLLEVRAVNAFRARGVGWKVIRQAEEKAAREFNASHPFCTLPFRTDGRRIFLDAYAASGERAIADFLASQLYFAQVVSPFLYGLDFGRGPLPLRWWPLGKNRRVVIDPRRSFGQPIVVEGVPTRILSRAASHNRLRDVKLWYEVSAQSVRDAVQFEGKRAA